MRVAFLAPLPPPRTGQSLCDLAVLERLNTNHDVEVIATSKGELRQGVGSFRHLGATARQVWRTLVAAVRVRRSDADTIYLSPSQTVVGHAKDLLLLGAMGSDKRRRAVLHLHGGGFAHVLNGRWAPLTRRWFGSVGAVIVLGPSLRGQLSRVVDEERVVEVVNFAADELFVDPAVPPQRWQQVNDRPVEAEPITVLYLSSLFASKGYPAVIDAAHRFAAEGDDRVRFVIAGGAPDPSDLDAVVSAADALANLTYVGELDDTARAETLRRAAVVAVPTRYPWEGQPLAILEAYASGSVVAATDHAGISDVFVVGRNGPLLVGDTPQQIGTSLADALRSLLDDPSGSAAIARHNRDRAELFRRDRFADEVVQVLEHAAAGMSAGR